MKGISPPATAGYPLLRPVIFEISLREISKTMGLKKYNLAQSAGKWLFILFIPEYLTPLVRRFDPYVDKYGISVALR